jgi:hypothetical protein
MSGRLVGAALLGTLLGLLTAIDLVLFGVVALDSVMVTLLPLLGLAVGGALGVATAARVRIGPTPATTPPQAAPGGRAYPPPAPGPAPRRPAAPPIATDSAGAALDDLTPPTGVPAFSPTHVVPADGLDARAAPDPNRTVEATLDPWLLVQVIDWYGEWAEIRCANGWEAWVDGRLLLAR